jgi:hypothetical protein
MEGNTADASQKQRYNEASLQQPRTAEKGGGKAPTSRKLPNEPKLFGSRIRMDVIDGMVVSVCFCEWV